MLRSGEGGVRLQIFSRRRSKSSQSTPRYFCCYKNMPAAFESLTKAKQFAFSSSLSQSSSGEGGIRTLDRIAPMLDFESSAFNHSATSPNISPRTASELFVALRGSGFVFAGWRQKGTSGLSLNVKQFTFNPLSHFSKYIRNSRPTIPQNELAVNPRFSGIIRII
jgi:hypothetical protein